MARAAIRYTVLGVLLACAWFFQGGDIARLIHVLAYRKSTPQYPFQIATASRTIASGPLRGDQLLAIHGRPIVSMNQITAIVESSAPGRRLRVTVGQPSGHVIETFVEVPSAAATMMAGGIAVAVCRKLLIPVIAIAFAFGVAAIRPSDPNAWILLMLLLGFAGLFSGLDSNGPAPGITTAWAGFWISLWPFSIAWFGLRFPERFRWERRRGWLKYVLLVISAGAGFFYFANVMLWYRDINAAQAHRSTADDARMVWLTCAAAGVFIFFCAVGAKVRIAKAADSRRRARILVLGSCIAFVPIFLVFDSLAWPLSVFATLMAAVFPMTAAYVIVVERAMGLRSLLRQAAGPGSEWIDRKFFRKEYEAEKALGETAEAAGRFVEIEPLLETVAARIGATLHVADIVILLRNGQDFRTAYSTRPGEALDVRSDSGIVRALARRPEGLRVWFENAPAWVRELDARDLQTLAFMRTELLLPIPGRDVLAGIMSLGPKLPESAYSRTEIRLLQSIAANMGVVVENGRS